MTYKEVISLENLFQAWEEFKKGKRNKLDIQEFELRLEDNLFNLHNDLKTKKYRHSYYEEFYVTDPKIRHIHKASVRDRVVHHLLYKHLYEIFDKHFIYDSYSCRIEKGTHKAVKRCFEFIRKDTDNFSSPCWILHLDIKKFFANVNQKILLHLLSARVKDNDILWLLREVIDSFSSEETGKGIPLGNLTSQVFSNIYLNELDQFVKHKLKVEHYIRYADDFIIISKDKHFLNTCNNNVNEFLGSTLKLSIHPDKVVLSKSSWGADFLGYIVLPHYILPRTKTKRRMYQKLANQFGKPKFNQSLASYLGYLSHANSYDLRKELLHNL